MKRKAAEATTKPLDNVIQIDEAQVRGHLDEMSLPFSPATGDC